MQNASAGEITYVAISVVGLICNVWCLVKSTRTLWRVYKHPEPDRRLYTDEKLVAWTTLHTVVALCYVQLFLLSLGVLALLVPPPTARPELNTVRAVLRTGYYLATGAITAVAGLTLYTRHVLKRRYLERARR